MRGISEERLRAILHNHILTPRTQSFVQYLIDDECRELQEPWIPLDEFLKSGFEGKCWVLKIDQEVQFTECYESITEQKVFSGNTGSIPHSRIIKVFPIHKPEPPKCP